MRRTVFLIVAMLPALWQTTGRAADTDRTLAIRAGRIMTVSSGTIENGVIIVRDGRVEGVGANLQIPGDLRIVDANNKTVVPGFIDAHGHLGLSLDMQREIDETVQPVTAEMQIVDAFDPSAEGLAQAVRCGVTATMLTPGSRNPVGGQTAVVKLAGGRRERWLVKQTAGVKLSFAGDALVYDRKPTSLPGLVTLVQEHLDKAKTYTAGQFDPSREVLSCLVQRALPAYVQAQTLDELDAAMNMIEAYNLEAVLVGAEQAGEIAERLAQRKVPVICGPLLRYSKDKDLRRPGRLADAGVEIAFGSFSGGTYAVDIRTSAILATRYGLGREEALKALTINAARLLGVSDRLGSIQKGRDADLVIFDSDPLEATARVEIVIIEGKIFYRRGQE